MGAAPLFSRMDNTSQLKDVEIFYLLNPRTDKYLLDQMSLEDVAAIDEENSKLQEIDYTQEGSKSVALPTDCRRLKLAMRFFQESQSN